VLLEFGVKNFRSINTHFRLIEELKKLSFDFVFSTVLIKDDTF